MNPSRFRRNPWLAACVAILVTTACDSKKDEKEAKGGKHEHQAPHGGTLVEFGGEFGHLELVLDPATGRLTGYFLDGEAEKPVRVAQKRIEIRVSAPPTRFVVVLTAAENKLTGETIGDTSQFEGQADPLKGLKEFDGSILHLLVREKAFSDIAFNFPKGNE